MPRGFSGSPDRSWTSDGKPNGSLVVIEAADAAAANALAAKDPYAMAGLFESVEIRPWNWVFNPPSNS